MFKFQILIVWQKAHTFVKDIFNLSNKLPRNYRFSLNDQLVRAALSITNNIAEGSGRSTKKDQNYFYSVARGSTLEVINMLLLVKDLSIIEEQTIEQLLSNAEEILKILYCFVKKNY